MTTEHDCFLYALKLYKVILEKLHMHVWSVISSCLYQECRRTGRDRGDAALPP